LVNLNAIAPPPGGAALGRDTLINPLLSLCRRDVSEKGSSEGIRSFEEWKKQAAAKLVELAAPSEKEGVRDIAVALLAELERLELKRLTHFLIQLYSAATLDKRFLEAMPGEREAPAWLYNLK